MKRLKRFVPGFRKITQVLAIFLILGLLYFIRPVYHSLVIGYISNLEVMPIAVGVTAVCVMISCRLVYLMMTRGVAPLFISIAYLMVSATVIFVYIVMMGTRVTSEPGNLRYSAEEVLRNNPPVMMHSNSLFQTRDPINPSLVAKYTGNKDLIRSYADDGRIIYSDEGRLLWDEGLLWVRPQAPSGIVDRIMGRSTNVTVVDQYGKSATLAAPAAFVGQYLNRHVWNMLIRKYFIRPDGILYVPVYGSQEAVRILTVVPYVGYDIRWQRVLPYWGGVFIIHDDGTIEDLSPEAAMGDERLRKQAIYPKELVIHNTNSWGEVYGACQGHHANAFPYEGDMPYHLESGWPDPYWIVFPEVSCATNWMHRALKFNARTGKYLVIDLEPSILNVLNGEVLAQMAFEREDPSFRGPHSILSDGRQPIITGTDTKEYIDWLYPTSQRNRFALVQANGIVLDCSWGELRSEMVMMEESCKNLGSSPIQFPLTAPLAVRTEGDLAVILNYLPQEQRQRVLEQMRRSYPTGVRIRPNQ